MLPSGSYNAGVEHSVWTDYVRVSTFHGTSTNTQYIKQLLGPAYIRTHQKYNNLPWNNTSVGALYFLHHSRSCASNSPNSVSFAGCTSSLSSESSFSPFQNFYAVIEISVFLLALSIALACAIIVTLFLLIEQRIQRLYHRKASVIYRFLVHFNCCLRWFVWKVISIILDNCLLLFPSNIRNRTLSFTISDSFQYLVVLHDSQLLVGGSTDRSSSTEEVMDIAVVIIGFLVACRSLIFDTEFIFDEQVDDGSKQDQVSNDAGREILVISFYMNKNFYRLCQLTS
jgi:hypothetical protein